MLLIARWQWLVCVRLFTLLFTLLLMPMPVLARPPLEHRLLISTVLSWWNKCSNPGLVQICDATNRSFSPLSQVTHLLSLLLPPATLRYKPINNDHQKTTHRPTLSTTMERDKTVWLTLVWVCSASLAGGAWDSFVQEINTNLCVHSPGGTAYLGVCDRTRRPPGSGRGGGGGHLICTPPDPLSPTRLPALPGGASCSNTALWTQRMEARGDVSAVWQPHGFWFVVDCKGRTHTACTVLTYLCAIPSWHTFCKSTFAYLLSSILSMWMFYFIVSSRLCCTCVLCVTCPSYCDFEFPLGINKEFIYLSIHL